MPPVYATRADVVIAAGGTARLLQLADHDADSKEDDDLVDSAIIEAESLINSYVRKKREVPLPPPVPDVIRTMTANIAVWVLKSRRDALTEADAMLQEQRVQWLENLARGKVDLGVNPAPAASPHNQPSATARPTSKAVSRENLKGFA